ncbi:MAG TPA: sigma-70 family RNA polymerase sigma factor [Flavilitoribacter sp.]|nr:sigma-70 family RNA polymerase sigma factor [Flavilitoribacter sp.]HMQ89263.1 sigma-70 family RNA polymerase sigma factor [Flavilitoribacter sp.]
MAELSDRQLLDGLARSEGQVIDHFYRQFLPGLIRYVTSRGGKEADARDIFQEVLLALFRKVRSDANFEIRAGLQTYLFSAGKYQWFTRQRRTQKIEPLEENPGDWHVPEDIRDTLLEAERFQLFHTCLEKLGDTCRKILGLHFQRQSTDEIAGKLDFSPGYVKKKKFECKQALKEAMQKDPRFPFL